MEISLAPETILHIGSVGITNSVLTGWIVTAILIVGAVIFRAGLKPIGGRFQNLIEAAYEALYSTTINVIGREDVARQVFPYLVALFFYALLSNWAGLIPGVGSIGIHELHDGKEVLVPLFRAPTSDLNTVSILALISMGYVQYLGLKHTGFKAYVRKFLNFKSPMAFFIGFLELVGEFTRVLSFAFRLFGNIFAGEVLIAVMMYLTLTFLPWLPILPLPFYAFEIFVGIMQAFIFCFLTAVFISLAIASHDEGHVKGGEDVAVSDVGSGHQPAIESDSQILNNS